MPYFTVTRLFFHASNLKITNCNECIDVQTDRLHKELMKKIHSYNLDIIDKVQDFT